MARKQPIMAAAFAAAMILPHVDAGAAETTSFAIRPSEVTPPAGIALGQYSRTIRPFENWTLICDEEIEAATMVCNITQTVEDRAGNLVFSWSLAATEGGSPYMILRTAPIMPVDGLIELEIAGRDAPVEVRIDGCNETVCLGMVPVGPILRAAIASEASPRISYPTMDGRTIEVETTFVGLSEALSAIR